MENTISLKDEGNQFFRKKEYRAAIEKYEKSIDMSDVEEDKELLGTLYSNLCACQMQLGDIDKAIESAEKCINFQPSWTKGYLRKMTCMTKKSEEKDNINEVVKNMYIFLQEFPRKDEETGKAEFTPREQKWVEEIQKNVHYYTYLGILCELFNLPKPDENTKTPIICVDSKGRGHAESVFQVVMNPSLPAKSKLLILNGEYNEVVVFEKKELELIGQDSRKVILGLKEYPKNISEEEHEDIDSALIVKQSKVYFKHMTIRNALENVNNTSLNVQNSSLGFMNCIVECPFGTGITFRDSSNIIMKKSVLNRCMYGILNVGKGKLTMTNCRVTFCEKSGLAIKDELDTVIKNTEFESGKNQAMIVLGPKVKLEMRKVKIHHYGQDQNCKTAVLINGSKNVLISDCEIMNNNFQAIQLKNSHAIVTKSKIGYHQIGVAVQENSNVIIRENEFISCSFGIWMTENHIGRIVIQENDLENNVIKVAKSPGAKDPEFVKQPDIEVVEYGDIVSSNPQDLRKMVRRKKKRSTVSKKKRVERISV